MDIHGPDEFAVPVSVLPADVVDCEGLPQKRWVRRGFTLKNEVGDDIVKAVYQCVDVDLILDGRPLGDDRVAVQIA